MCYLYSAIGDVKSIFCASYCIKIVLFNCILHSIEELVYYGPAGIVKGLRDQYDLNSTDEIERLIKHIACALRKSIKENEDFQKLEEVKESESLQLKKKVRKRCSTKFLMKNVNNFICSKKLLITNKINVTNSD